MTKIDAKSMRHLLLVLVTFLATVASETNTWYVAKEDSAAADTAIEGRGSEALPFRTIQAALDNPDFEAGDIVLVKRGDYDEGEHCLGGTYNMTNRVYISKTVHLKAVDGRDVTRIVGKWGKKGASDSSLDGIRCIYVAAAAVGTEIEGFTLENGYAYGSGAGGYNGSSYSRERNFGGGIYVADKLKKVYVVNCVFRNCLANLGPAITGGTLIRCVIHGCRSVLGDPTYGTGPHMLYSTYAFACVVTKSIGKVTTYMLDNASVAVNCTFHDNSCASLSLPATSTSGTAYNCIFAANTAQSEYPEDKLVDSYVSTVSTNMAFATGLGDYRLPSDSPAIGTGDAAHRQVLMDLGVPAKYLEKDFNGATIDWSAESFNPGASQGVAVPATATIKFTDSARVNGAMVYANQFIRSEKFPEIFEFAPADTSKTFFGFTRSTEGSSVRLIRPSKVFLGMNGVARVVLPLRSTMAHLNYAPHYAAEEIWTDPNDGSDENGDGSEANPYETIQYALGKATKDYTVIRAKRGDYRKGGAAQAGLMSRVNFKAATAIHTLVRSEEGPLVTTIWGAADPETVNEETEPGCGTNAVRCVCGYTPYSAIQGFTLRDGHTLSSRDEGADGLALHGAAVGCSDDSQWSAPTTVLDCIMTNCVSAGSIVRTAFTKRCLITGNTAAGKIFYCGFHAADLIQNNRCAGILARKDSNYYGRLWMTTAVGNTLVSEAASYNDWEASGEVYGSIFVNGRVDTAARADVGNVVWEHDSVSGLKSTSVNADPLFADKSAGDYRPAIGGPAVGYTAATSMSLFCFYLGSDFYGNPLRISEDGKLTSGCVQGGALPYAVSVTSSLGDAGILVNGVSGDCKIAVEAGGTFSVSADTGTSRYAKGYTVNGVEHLFSSYPGGATVTMPGETVAIAPIVSTEWHVDAENGNDATGNGFTPGTAKRTLAEVFTNCAVAAYDTVYAHPGTYKDGEMRLSETAPVASRAIVPANVTLKATGSADETIILGAWAPEENRQGNYGQGTNAVRCVAMRAGAVVDGFTLTGGRTLVGATEYDSYGAGVYGVNGDKTSLVKNCIISNNVAGLGGGGAHSRYLSCKFLNNRATYNGDGAATYRSGVVQNCLAEGNSATYIIMYPSSVYNCTIGRNNDGRGVWFFQPKAEEWCVFNSIVYRPGPNQSIYWNCALGNDRGTSVSAEYLLHGTISTNVAALKLDENLRPAIDSPVVDAGDNEKRGTEFPETDLDGVPRVLNGGRFDIGAYEYDWRKEYSRTLGKHIEVTDVTSNVVKSANAVCVPEGSLSLDWQSQGDVQRTFVAAVTGEGTLTVLLGGADYATLTAADGQRTFALPGSETGQRFDFLYSGDGYAELTGFAQTVGFRFMIR